MKKGKLLVFEGIDGSGKTTQIKLLSKKLKVKNIPYEVISFPQYGKNEFANQIYDYLSGKFGKLAEIDPYTIAKVYASDRKTVKDLVKSWLESGKLVIANRYVSSSKAHLGANLPKGRQQDFFKWLESLEYETNKMPREDITILLDADPAVSQKNLKGEEKKDIHEGSLKHLTQAGKIYLQLAKKNPNWYVIDCMKSGQMRTKEDIHRQILDILEKVA